MIGPSNNSRNNSQKISFSESQSIGAGDLLRSQSMRVFVCYPREHEKTARELHSFLVAVGLDSWFDRASISAGEDWDRNRREALSRADAVVVVCSPDTLNRDGVYHRELREALELEKDRRLGSAFIFPVRTEVHRVPTELARFQFTDYFEPNWKQVLAKGLKLTASQRQKEIPSALSIAAAQTDEDGVISLSFQEENDRAEFDIAWIKYDLEGQYWDYVNGCIQAKVFGDYYTARRHLAESERGGSLEIQLSEFFRKGELVSLSIGWFEYWSGAAHPNHGLVTLNFFGSDGGKVSVGELFDFSPDAHRHLLEFSDLDLKRQGRKSGDTLEIAEFVDEDDEWSIFEQFSFNDLGMQLNFSASSGLPHVFGHHEVYVPWQSVESLLTPASCRILGLRSDKGE